MKKIDQRFRGLVLLGRGTDQGIGLTQARNAVHVSANAVRATEPWLVTDGVRHGVSD